MESETRTRKKNASKLNNRFLKSLGRLLSMDARASSALIRLYMRSAKSRKRRKQVSIPRKRRKISQPVIADENPQREQQDTVTMKTKSCIQSNAPLGFSVVQSADKSQEPTRDSETCEGSIRVLNGRAEGYANGSDQKTQMRKFVVRVCRPEEVEKARSNLPIVMMEQEIMEAINENCVVIVCGETGSGKTTQIPQFLFEAGYGSSKCMNLSGIIGITQPRRVAVLATAKRVAFELNLRLGCEVGFQVRHDRQIGVENCIKFMTDGILLRELQTDFLLRKYSVIVLDEAHERSINTDILIGMLSRLIPLRQRLSEQQCHVHQEGSHQDNSLSIPHKPLTPLKLVIMSATLRVEDFTSNQRMFPVPPPVLEVPSRQFPVTIHFSSKTELKDYETRAFKKVCAIHQKLPAGGILVFLTGRREVESLCRRLRKTITNRRMQMMEENASGCLRSKITCGGITKLESLDLVQGQELGELDLKSLSDALDVDQEFDVIEGESADSGEESVSDITDIESDSDDILNDAEIDVDGGDVNAETGLDQSEMGLCNMTGDLASHENFGGIEKTVGVSKVPGKVRVVPLYAMLPAVAQLMVFSAVPKGTRLIVVSTNVAETSLTIPGIRYVVDCGRAKEREFSPSTGISKFKVQWISKASAEQRAGRAGRTGPGHCYRLFSSAHFNNNFPEFSVPELSRAPLEGTVLTLKCMGIDKVINFPFPTPPESTALAEAERCLVALSALHPSTKLPTPIGKAMALLPLSPRHARMLLRAIQEAESIKKNYKARFLIAYAIAVAAALSVENPFIGDSSAFPEIEPLENHEQKTNESISKGPNPGSVHAKFLNPSSDAFSVVNALWAYERSESSEQFCRQNFLHSKTMSEMSKLRKQLSEIVSRHNRATLSKLNFFKGKNETVLASAVMYGLGEFWLHLESITLDPDQEILLQRAICAGWADRVARKWNSHGKSVIRVPKLHRAVRYQSCAFEDAVFLHPLSSVSKVAPEYVVYKELIHTSKPYMWGVTCVKDEWLVSLSAPLCSFSKPLAEPPPWYDNKSDEIMCFVSPSFGPHLWELPLYGVPLRPGTTRICIFAFSLLEGKVLTSLAQFRPYLSASPSLLLRPEGRMHKRVNEILHRLDGSPIAVDSRLKLAKVWKVDSRFLYEELLGWIQSYYHRQFTDLWENIKEEATGAT